MKGKLSRPPNLFLVTFDLSDTVPGDARYATADDALCFHGSLYKPVKQVRILITRRSAARIKAAVIQRIGREVTIMIIPLRSIPAWRINGHRQRSEWKRLVHDVQAAGVEVAGLTHAVESLA